MALVTSCSDEKIEIFSRALPMERINIGTADSIQNSLCLHFGAAEYMRWLAMIKMKPSTRAKHLLPYLSNTRIVNG